MKKPYFSIIIPTLNEEKFLPRLLASLKKQKEKDFEIIVVDGKSIDKTKDIVNQFQKYLPINLFQVNKKNVSFQRNFGAKKARGDYLIFLDADCEVFPTFIKTLKKNIMKKKGLFFIPYLLPERGYKKYLAIFNFINLIIELTQSLNKPFSAGGFMIIEKHFFKLLGGFDEQLFISEDHDLVYQASQWGVKAKPLSKVKIRVSLRRLKKEGGLKLFYKFSIASTKYLFGEKIKNKIFDYEMGGQIYQDVDDKKNKKKIFEEYLYRARKAFKSLIREIKS